MYESQYELTKPEFDQLVKLYKKCMGYEDAAKQVKSRFLAIMHHLNSLSGIINDDSTAEVLKSDANDARFMAYLGRMELQLDMLGSSLDHCNDCLISLLNEINQVRYTYIIPDVACDAVSANTQSDTRGD